MHRSTGRRHAAAAAAVGLAGLLAACGGASGGGTASAPPAGSGGPGGSASVTSGPASAPGAPSGGASSTGPSDEPSLPPSKSRPATEPGPRAPAACRTAPGASTGPAAAAVTLRLTQVLVTGGAGGVLTVRGSLTVTADGPRIVLQPAASGLAVVRDGVVVGWTAGTGAAVPLPLAAGRTHPAQVLPAAAMLVDCDGGPLPAGTYTVQAVVGYGGDPLQSSSDGAAGRFSLVSEPVVVRVP